MHTVWKSRGRVSEVFAKFWEGGYIGVVKIFGGGYTFLVFFYIFINKFSKNFGGRVYFYPPLTPPPPVCIYVFGPPRPNFLPISSHPCSEFALKPLFILTFQRLILLQGCQTNRHHFAHGLLGAFRHCQLDVGGLGRHSVGRRHDLLLRVAFAFRLQHGGQ